VLAVLHPPSTARARRGGAPVEQEKIVFEFDYADHSPNLDLSAAAACFPLLAPQPPVIF
jgi:hypothetical protein